MKRRLFGTIISVIAAISLHAQIAGQDYVVEKNGDVVITKIINGLSLNRHEIYQAGLKYLENAYKDTKYKIVINSSDNCVAAGEGKYVQFHEDNFFPYSYFLDAPFILRIDGKDARARIMITFSYYTGKRSNINETIDIHDRISNFQPVNEAETEHRKLYGKAFPILLQKASKTIGEVEAALRSTLSSAPSADW